MSTSNSSASIELHTYTVKQLKQYCKEHGITSYSRYKKKADLISYIETKIAESIVTEPVITESVDTKLIVVDKPVATVEVTDNTITKNIIHNQDCIEGMKQLPDNYADIILCDPPYNIGKDFGNDSDKQSMEDYLTWCDEWISECIRILKPNGTFYIYGFSEILAFIRVRIPISVRWIIWHYTNKTVPSLNF